MTTLFLLATTSDPVSMKMWAYIGFIALVMFFLALDLGVFHREAHAVNMKESITWSCIWLACGLSFTGFIYYAYEYNWLGLGLETPVYASGAIALGDVTGGTAAIQYLTGYIVEKSLAMDNIFVIAMIFGYTSRYPQNTSIACFSGESSEHSSCAEE
jgi:tellurite resistance protein TerC